MKTLGDILYADKSRLRVSEDDWLQLVRGVAAGDQRALHSLYQQTHRIVFTLVVRVTANRQTADELTLDVFGDVWRKASAYNPADGSVVGWIMNQARRKAVDRLLSLQRKKGLDSYPQSTVPTMDMVDFLQACLFEEQSRLLRYALEFLSPEERTAIETTFFAESTYDEAAKKLNQPLATVKTRIRSGLRKLCETLDGKHGRTNGVAHSDEHLDLVFPFALQALPPHEIALAEAQLASCEECRQELETLRPVLQSFVGWSTDVLRPAESLWGRLAERIAAETAARPFVPPPAAGTQPEWEEAAPSVFVKILAINTQTDGVSMLVRLDPGTSYPGHLHAGAEELHLLHGILKVNDRTFYPGDFRRSEAGSVDHRVWSITGCTCFLVTSAKDELF